jgi:hypothetical protein
MRTVDQIVAVKGASAPSAKWPVFRPAERPTAAGSLKPYVLSFVWTFALRGMGARYPQAMTRCWSRHGRRPRQLRPASRPLLPARLRPLRSSATRSKPPYSRKASPCDDQWPSCRARPASVHGCLHRLRSAVTVLLLICLTGLAVHEEAFAPSTPDARLPKTRPCGDIRKPPRTSGSGDRTEPARLRGAHLHVRQGLDSAGSPPSRDEQGRRRSSRG